MTHQPTELGARTDLVESFRTAMRRFAVTVSIITTTKDDGKSGMTATAVSSVSMDPPALLVCVNRTATIHSDMELGKKFCVNILSADHSGLSSAFGGKLPAHERFSLGTWHAERDGPPYLDDAQANLFCTVDATIDYGTHTIFIGKVIAVRLQGAVRPLVYGDGRYLFG